MELFSNLSHFCTISFYTPFIRFYFFVMLYRLGPKTFPQIKISLGLFSNNLLIALLSHKKLVEYIRDSSFLIHYLKTG